MNVTINENLYKKDAHWQEGEYDVYRTCHWSGPGCHDSCGMLYYVKDGKLEKVEGDPNQPYNRGRLCMRCLNLPEAVYHQDRLKWPLKRIGERGENKWERISWDEAYDIIVENVRRIQQEYGPESIVGMEGTGRNICWQVPLLTYAGFGSPNFAMGFLSGDACMVPRTSISFCVLGDLSIVDCSQMNEERYNHPEYCYPEVILIIGNNPVISNGDGFLGHWIVDCMIQGGTKLITVDPQLTWLASRSEIWLQLRPGTDTALVLAMMHVMINEDLYDKDYVEKWCYGFEELKERVSDWTPKRAANICWCDENDIVNAARLYAAAKPGALQWGLATDMSINGIPQAHALMCMNALCGNIEVPGGNIISREVYNMNLAYQVGYFEFLDEDMRAKRIGDDISPMHMFGFSSTAQGDAILRAIETGKPYPIKMLWFQTSNPIANMAGEAPRVYDAIRSTDFNVVVDLFMTPTAVACADIVLPAGMSVERNSLRTWWTPLRAISKMIEYEECKSDETIVLELGKRLNPENWPFEDDIALLNQRLLEGEAPATFEELRDQVYIWPEHIYRRHEKGLLRPDGEPGFNTPTGKIELYCTTLEGFGNDPLPYYEEPPESPVTTPELYNQYPLVLTTGRRSYEWFHSEQRQQKTMREFHPDPLIDIHPETAAKYGIKQGDWVWIENKRGRCRQRANLTVTMDPRVVNTEHGWWFPEEEGAEPSLFGVFNSNINNLTTQCVTGDTGYGAPYKNTLCRIYPATEENSRIMPGEQVTKLGGFKYVRN